MTEEKIIVLHLVDGCEVIGRFLSENDRGIDIADAMLIRYGLNSNGNYAFYFNKYCPYDVSPDAYFKKTMIVSTHREIMTFVTEHYYQAVDRMKKMNYNTILDNASDQELNDGDELTDEMVEEFLKNKKPNRKLH